MNKLMRRRRGLSLACVIVLLLGLVACGGAASPEPTKALKIIAVIVPVVGLLVGFGLGYFCSRLRLKTHDYEARLFGLIGAFFGLLIAVVIVRVTVTGGSIAVPAGVLGGITAAIVTATGVFAVYQVAAEKSRGIGCAIVISIATAVGIATGWLIAWVL